MPDYVLYAASASAPTELTGRVPMSTLSWGERLGDLGGTLTWTVPARLDHPDLAGLTPAETIVWLERDGQLVSSGWLRAISVSPADEIATYTCTGLMSYFRHRVVRQAISETSIDVLALARQLIDDAQGVSSFGNIGITTGTETAGRTRAINVPVSDHAIVGELFVALADEDGWEWRTDHAWVGGTPTATLVLRSDLLGRPAAHAIEHGGTIDLGSLEWDGTGVATTVTAVGSGQGEEQPSATAVGTPTKLLLETVVSSGEADQAAVERVAATALGALGVAPVRLSGTLRGSVDLGVGSFVIGDQARARADVGVITVHATYRIAEYSVTVDAAGTERVSMGFAPLTAWES